MNKLKCLFLSGLMAVMPVCMSGQQTPGEKSSKPRVIITCDPELVREALYTLCALRRPLTRRAVSGRLSAMPPAERKALLRYVVAEGYSPGPLRRLLDERERPYYESLVQTYKRSLA